MCLHLICEILMYIHTQLQWKLKNVLQLSVSPYKTKLESCY